MYPLVLHVLMCKEARGISFPSAILNTWLRCYVTRILLRSFQMFVRVLRLKVGILSFVRVNKQPTK